ncbi:protein phosphatase 1A-like [Paramacrobiotus metropolitanus]|uniref:protein phosphatase 1A-like n=1 Tax=Paramacrobiotus metropolitanus TaxID=2943436 RepID=UPI0024461BAF|nr:protein phosphatase 1A-like [Paramacrobiotus metropolitanus]
MSASQPMMLELENQRNYVAGSGNGVQFAVCLDQGGQKTMEDCHSAVTALDEPFSCWSFFAVYDGHEGNAVSQWSAVQLPRFFLASHEMSQLYKEHLPASERDGLIRRGLLKGFLQMDEELRGLPEMQADGGSGPRGGSTASCALITPEWIYLVNCGDSRGVLVSRRTVVLASRDHKPSLPAERQRIERAGFCVQRQRLDGRLAMSRSLGDFRYKAVATLDALQQAVSPEPDIFRWERTVQDEFILLASDGIWDVMETEALCEDVGQWLEHTNDLQSVCARAIDEAVMRDSRDNATVAMIAFPASVRMSPEKLQMETALDKIIELVVTDVVHWLENKSDEDDVHVPDLQELLCCTRTIMDENGVSVPNNSGIGGKRHLIERTWNRMRSERLSVRCAMPSWCLSLMSRIKPRLAGRPPLPRTIDADALAAYVQARDADADRQRGG